MVKMLVAEDDIVERQALCLDIVAHIGLLLCARVDNYAPPALLVDEQVGVRRHRLIVEPQDLDVIAKYSLHRW